MLHIVTEHPTTFEMVKVTEKDTEQEARMEVREMIERGSHDAFWIVNPQTGEIL